MNYIHNAIKFIFVLLFILMLGNSLHFYEVVGFPFGKDDLHNYIGFLWLESDLVHLLFMISAKTISYFIGIHNFFIYFPLIGTFVILPILFYNIENIEYSFYMIFGTSLTIWFYIVGLYAQSVSMIFFWLYIYHDQKPFNIKYSYMTLSIFFHYYVLFPIAIYNFYKIERYTLFKEKDIFQILTLAFIILAISINFDYTLFVSNWDLYIMYYYHINPILLILFYIGRNNFYSKWSFMYLVGMFSLNSRIILYSFPFIVKYAYYTIKKEEKETQLLIGFMMIVYYLWIFEYQIGALINEAMIQGYNYGWVKIVFNIVP